MQRGISEEDATALIVNGFCREIFKNLPMEFAVEAKKVTRIKFRRRSRLNVKISELSVSVDNKLIIDNLNLEILKEKRL